MIAPLTDSVNQGLGYLTSGLNYAADKVIDGSSFVVDNAS